MFTARYKIDIPGQRNPAYEFYEYACHEGNVQVLGCITSTSPRFAALREAQWTEQREKPSPGAGLEGGRQSLPPASRRTSPPLRSASPLDGVNAAS